MVPDQEFHDPEGFIVPADYKVFVIMEKPQENAASRSGRSGNG
jgi:hypothetical protein